MQRGGNVGPEHHSLIYDRWVVSRVARYKSSDHLVVDVGDFPIECLCELHDVLVVRFERVRPSLSLMLPGLEFNCLCRARPVKIGNFGFIVRVHSFFCQLKLPVNYGNILLISVAFGARRS